MSKPLPYDKDKIAYINEERKSEFQRLSEEAEVKRLKKEWDNKLIDTLEQLYDINVQTYDYDYCYEYMLNIGKEVSDDLAPINFLHLNKTELLFKRVIKVVSMVTLCKSFAHTNEDFEICGICDDIIQDFIITMNRVYQITISHSIRNKDFELKLNRIHSIYEGIFKNENNMN